jgi:hypothetical protein
MELRIALSAGKNPQRVGSGLSHRLRRPGNKGALPCGPIFRQVPDCMSSIFNVFLSQQMFPFNTGSSEIRVKVVFSIVILRRKFYMVLVKLHYSDLLEMKIS